ncbi:uncharacterized protein LOC103723293 [Phoenix dactylifera]|uniref:Uncharacterized protein LOC103723293 n=1 Tax=Phoenix dactylifera TaxID=42345 RepID=A0A8B7D3R2_PHODC|nr:uncharacterized protein LOC103723293 [Phoenix dactylifera]
MAIRCSYPGVILPRGQTKKAMPRASMLHNSHIQHSRAAATSSCKPFAANKVVFEDQAMGIVCYIDGQGEVICEGYDEGPRFSRWSSNGADHQRRRDHQIPDFQQRMKLQIAKDDDFYRIIRKQN